MASPPEPDLMEARRHLAGLIDAALEVGQRGDGRSAAWWRPWGNVRFADKVFAAEAAVRSWRNRDNPSRPRNIVPLLKVLYGDVPKFAEAKKAMQDAWRAAGGLSETEPPPLPPQTIDGQDFIDVARIVDLSVFQPMPDNADDNQFLPFRLIISPDRRCEIAGKKIEIGVSEALVMIQSDHWQPCRESVFSSKTHTNVHKDATPNGLHLIGPRNAAGCIDGEPLEDVPMVKMEPTAEAPDSAIEVSVRVYRDGFMVTPLDGDVTGTQKVVLDAIFASAIDKDAGKRLIVARRTVKPRSPRATR